MRKILKFSLITALLVGISTLSFGQEELSKKERKRLKKKWKKEAKEYSKSPLEFKERMEGMQAKINELTEERDSLTNRYNECMADNAALQAEIDAMNKKAGSGQVKQEKRPEQSMDGLVMKVQMGSYENYDISMQFAGKILMTEDYDGKLRYQIGKFTDLATAKEFASNLQKMGIKDAWVVPYLNGEFIPIEELEAKIESGEIGY